MSDVRPCRDQELPTILAIVNAAAEAYRGVIPPDRWHEPYMPEAELRREIAAGVAFWGFQSDGGLVGVMGIQRVQDVDLIRHAYVLPGHQRRGVGAALIGHLCRQRRQRTRRMLIGTWGRCELGDRLLPPPRFRAGSLQVRACVAQDLLVHPGTPDRDLGGVGESVNFRRDVDGHEEHGGKLNHRWRNLK